MAAPDEPIVTYPVRTAPGYAFAAGMIFLLALVGGATLVFVIQSANAQRLGEMTGAFVAVIVVAFLAPLGYWWSTPAYRIGGGRGAIRFFAERLEVPTVQAGGHMTFARGELMVISRELKVRYGIAGFTAASVRRGFLLQLRAGGRGRDLSTLTLTHPDAFVADLQAFVAGGRPLGPGGRGHGHAGAPLRPPTDGERLDAELARLD